MKYKHLIKVTFLMLALLLTLTFLSGCGRASGKRIEGEAVYSQLNEYIEKGMADGSIGAISSFWYDHADEGKSFDFSGLDDRNGIIYFGTKSAKPFSFMKDNAWTGLTIELIYCFCKDNGYGIRIAEYGDVNSIVLAISEGKCDIGGANISITEERKKSAAFSPGYYYNVIGAVINKANHDKYRTPEDFAGACVGCLTGSAAPGVAAKIIPDFTHQEFNSLADGCLALSQKKIEGFFSDEIYLKYAIREYPDLEFTCPLNDDDVLGFVYPKARSGEGFFDRIASSFRQTFIEEERWRLILTGVINTLIITLGSITAGFVLGILVYLLCRNGGRITNVVTRVCQKVIDGLPAVVFLMIFYYIIFGSFNISNVLVSTIAFTLIFASSVFSMAQNAVAGVDKLQYEVSYALGYSRRRTFYRMILPQAARLFWLPCQAATKAQIKATAIVGYIATIDITKAGDMIRSSTFRAFFPLLTVAVLYFLLGWLFAKLIDHIRIHTEPSEKKSKRYLKGIRTDH